MKGRGRKGREGRKSGSKERRGRGCKGIDVTRGWK